MSTPSSNDFDNRLIDLHLGHLSAEQADELRRQIDADLVLRAQHNTLAGVFNTLDSWTDDPAPDDLADRIIIRAAAAGRPPRISRDAITETAEATPAPRERRISLGGLREVLAIAAVIVLAVGIGFPSLLHLRERSYRLGCSWNLAQIGRGIQQYATAFNSSLPFVGWSGTDSWQSTDNPEIVTVPNRRHVYPLLRLAFVRDPQFFICPAQCDVPMPRAQIHRRQDFLEDGNVSYAYQNMAGVRPSANDDANLPILADDNPLFADGLPLFDARRLRITDPAQRNSHAHGGAGQNILTLGAHVKWVTSPLAGINNDNIWTLEGITEYTGREGPTSANDTHLIK